MGYQGWDSEDARARVGCVLVALALVGLGRLVWELVLWLGP